MEKVDKHLNGNQSLFVAVWRKPFSRHLNNFFNIGTKRREQQQNDAEEGNNYDNLDTTPKRDTTMNAFFLQMTQRACVIEYCKKVGFFKNVFGLVSAQT